MLLTGCGSTASVPAPAHPEIYLGSQRIIHLGSYVRRRVGALGLLLPAELDTHTLNVFSESTLVQAIDPTPDLHHALAVTTAVINRPDRVELIAFGPRGAGISLIWQESCGAKRLDPEQAATDGSGGELEVTARLPLVILAPLPAQRGSIDSCYLSEWAIHSTFTTPHRGSVSLEIVNY